MPSFAGYAVVVLPHVPPLRRPVDFFEFWSRTIHELDRTPPALERQAGGVRAGLALERIAFASLGNARIHGYLLRWADGAPRPLVVHGHGYGGRSTPSRSISQKG